MATVRNAISDRQLRDTLPEHSTQVLPPAIVGRILVVVVVETPAVVQGCELGSSSGGDFHTREISPRSLHCVRLVSLHAHIDVRDCRSSCVNCPTLDSQSPVLVEACRSMVRQVCIVDFVANHHRLYSSLFRLSW